MRASSPFLMRIAFVTLPALSHLRLLAAVAKLVGVRRSDVCLVTGKSAKPICERLALPFILDGSLNIDFDRRSPSRLPFRQQILSLDRFPIIVTAIRQILIDYGFDAVVTDCHFGVPVAGRSLGLPVGVVLNGPAWLLHPAQLFKSALEAETQCLETVSRDFGVVIAGELALSDILVEGCHTLCLGTIQMAEALGDNVRHSLPPERFIGFPPLSVIPARPLAHVSHDVLCSFGSLPAPEELLIPVLERLLGLGFRIAVAGEYGFRMNGVNFLGWVDDLITLMRCSRVVVHHGGIATTLECLAAKRPALVLPLYETTDQPINARLIERLGAGYQSEHTSPWLSSVVADLLDSKELLRGAEYAGNQLVRATIRWHCDRWVRQLCRNRERQAH